MTSSGFKNYHYGLACGMNSKPMHGEIHSHDGMELTFFLPGKPAILRFSGSIIEVEPEYTLLFWASIPHRIIFLEKQTCQYWITIPLDIFLQWKLKDDMVQSLLNGNIFIENDPELRKIDLINFPQWLEELHSSDEEVKKTLCLSLKDRLNRFCCKELTKESTSSEMATNSPLTLQDSFQSRMYTFLSKHYKEQLSLRRIAAGVGITEKQAEIFWKSHEHSEFRDFVNLLRISEALSFSLPQI